MFELGFWPGPGTYYERGEGTNPNQWLMFANTQTPMKLYILFNPVGDAMQNVVENY